MNDPKTVNDAWRDALNRADPDAVAACFAQDGVLADHGTGLRATGRVGNREAAAAFFKAFTDLYIEQTSHLTVGSEFAAEWIMRGVHTGDLPGMPATGRSFSGAGATFTQLGRAQWR